VKYIAKKSRHCQRIPDVVIDFLLFITILIMSFLFGNLPSLPERYLYILIFDDIMIFVAIFHYR